MSIFDEPSTEPDQSTASARPRFPSGGAAKAGVFVAVAVVSALVGSVIAKHGTSAQPVADVARARQPGAAGPNGFGPGGGGPGGGRRFDGGDDIAVAARTIGISESDLQTALQSGQSMAQVASAHGVAAQKVIDAIVSARTQELTAAVQSGRLTQAQADQIVANMTDRVTRRVNGTGFAGGPPPGFGPNGPGGAQQNPSTRKV